MDFVIIAYSLVEVVHHNRQVERRPSQAFLHCWEAVPLFIRMFKEREAVQINAWITMRKSRRGRCQLEWRMNYCHYSGPLARRCGGLLCGLHQDQLVHVGRAGFRLVLNLGHRCCVSVGPHQQHLGMLRWLRHIQVVLHASHHNHHVSSP